jgi:Rod binding domain-containing protein
VTDSGSFGTVSMPVTGPLAAQADRVMASASQAGADDSKIEKSARDFESLLLSTWLQQAEQSFASVPGGDEDDDADAGKEQLQAIAMQSLATSMTESGGIGIAKIISSHLRKAEEARLEKSTLAALPTTTTNPPKAKTGP